MARRHTRDSQGAELSREVEKDSLVLNVVNTNYIYVKNYESEGD
jgi:hypothetical protein